MSTLLTLDAGATYKVDTMTDIAPLITNSGLGALTVAYYDQNVVDVVKSESPFVNTIIDEIASDMTYKLATTLDAIIEMSDWPSKTPIQPSEDAVQSTFNEFDLPVLEQIRPGTFWRLRCGCLQQRLGTGRNSGERCKTHGYGYNYEMGAITVAVPVAYTLYDADLFLLEGPPSDVVVKLVNTECQNELPMYGGIVHPFAVKDIMADLYPEAVKQ